MEEAITSPYFTPFGDVKLGHGRRREALGLPRRRPAAGGLRFALAMYLGPERADAC